MLLLWVYLPGLHGRAFLCLKFCGCLCRPLRGLARSHRDITVPKTCGVLVGAGKPAKRPAQPHIPHG
ncbi:hypothetical protein C6A77_05150 [Pseudomonas sp. AFG_SD02_1510_Pfu_092]|nr:hypothetical protein C6A77_05150 [Pseudomonas sp. AFG_SD02_1510_Pfu_092]